jgi:hypothetical protein
MIDPSEALRKYREMKRLQTDKTKQMSKGMKKERMMMLHNEESGTLPLKEGQPIKVKVMGTVGKGRKEGYPIRVDWAHMHNDDDENPIKEKPKIQANPSA